MNKLNVKPVAFALSSLIVISYILCVVYGVFFQAYPMHTAWEALLPGFVWLTWTTFLLGLVETILYGIYIAIVFVPLYNWFNGKYSHNSSVG
jgi:2TM family of unknown function (DUF5676)